MSQTDGVDSSKVASPTYFIRHTAKIDIDNATREVLWSERRIAIHYPHNKDGTLPKSDNTSLDPDDYSPNGRKAVRAMASLAREGGYVCAEYFGQSECAVGYIPPASRIELFNGVWGHNGKQEGRRAVLKTLKLTKVQLLKPSDYAVISIGRPRQGTITRWPNASDAIESIVESRQRKTDLLSLSTPRQETMCSEFLRLEEAKAHGLPQLVNLLLPVGRTMRDVDIIAVAEDGKRIYAQVTYSGFDQNKFNALKKYKDKSKSHLIFFCACLEAGDRDDVIIFPIRRVFDIFCSTPLGSRWLKQAL